MKENLLAIGSIVKADIRDNEEQAIMIIGKRIVNPNSMKAWDYVGVDYPKGLIRHFNKENQFTGDDFYYFNHPDILKVLRRNTLKTLEENEENTYSTN